MPSRSVARLKYGLMRFARSRGWTVSRFNPYQSLPDYLCSMLFPSLGINCVVDVGAHFGEFGGALRNHGYRGHIASFEPVSQSYQVLKGRCSEDPRWQAYPYALSDRGSAMTMNVMDGTNYSSFLTPIHNDIDALAGNTVSHTEMVEVRRLEELFDTVVGQIARPRVYLKLDTQGWDINVLHGAEGCLSSIVAAQSEMSVMPLYEGCPAFRDALEEFDRHGFAPSAMFPVFQDPNLRLVEFDCVMVRG